MTIWVVMAAAGLITFGIRLSFIALLGRVDFPRRLQQALRFVPPAVLSALVFPELLMPEGVLSISFENERLIAGLAAALTAWFTRNAVLTVIIGMAVLYLVRMI
jgi:branched-subunit amino acid transport protein